MPKGNPRVWRSAHLDQTQVDWINRHLQARVAAGGNASWAALLRDIIDNGIAHWPAQGEANNAA